MGIGLDPRLILAHQQYTGPDPHETVRTMAQLAESGLRQNGLRQEQAQGRSLADIARANAQNPGALGSALLAGGHLKEGLATQEQQAQTGAHNATAQRQQKMGERELFEFAIRPALSVKSQAELDGVHSLWEKMGIPQEFTAQLPRDFESAAPLIKRYADMMVPAEKRADMEHRGAEAEKERTFRDGQGTKRDSAAERRARILAGQKVAERAADDAKGKQLPSTVLGELADYDTAQSQVDDLFAKAEEDNISGLGARANQAVTDALGLQGSDAARFEGASAPVRQGVGTILEGGKLAAGDEGKYKNMLPKYGDSKAVLAEKKKAINKYLSTRKAERIKTLKSGGYQVPEANGGSFNLGADAPAKPASEAEYNALPPGSLYIGPTGETHRKGG